MSALDLFDATPWRLEPQSSAIGMTVRLARSQFADQEGAP
jgi:hypothetical protein